MRRGKTRAGEGRAAAATTSIYAYYDETVGLAAGELAVRLVNHLVEQRTRTSTSTPSSSSSSSAASGPPSARRPRRIVDEAVSRDIPYLRLNEPSLVQLGQGVHQKRIRATMTSQTSARSRVDIASDKELTNQLLAAAGLPVPRVAVGADGRRGGPASPTRIGYPGGAQAAGRQPRSRRDARPAPTTTTCARASRSPRRESRGGVVIVETLRHRQRLPRAS